MTSFVTNGPDIPDHLLQEHEDGHVVFFCGSGISIPAGLPNFKGLVDNIYEKLGIVKKPPETEAYDKEQYDAALHQLERRLPGGRIAVRNPLPTLLKPKWRRKDALTTHRALLQLARDRKGMSRILTTNFDLIFQRVIQKDKLGIDSFSAPLLPIPKPSRWNGIVYLHGMLPGEPDNAALNRLVLSSGDFGLAYLTERWAARFVSTLFQNYIICFVGYSVNDPVFRYMMDALAADELLGEKKSEAYAFADFSGDENNIREKEVEWKAKGITPLLYEVPENSQDHSALHDTLKNWADTYRDGVRGKEMIIAQHAPIPPLTSSRTDFAVGRVLWALTDGLAARRFADLNPVPPLEWLGPLMENQFEGQDLPRFGITPNGIDTQLSFSILQRPSPYLLSPWMRIVDTGMQEGNWDESMSQLARWLTRHLDDPKLIIWLAGRGGHAHEKFARLIRNRMEELGKLKNDGKQEELERISANAPRAIPEKPMRILWLLLLSGRLKSHDRSYAFRNWLQQIKREGVTPSLRIQLREILAPRVKLRPPYSSRGRGHDRSVPLCIRDIVDWELVLSSDHVHVAFQREINKIEKWQEYLPHLLEDFTLLLSDAVDLMRELEGVNEKRDLSYLHQPSIGEHPQNSNFRDWTALIRLTRDAWLATAQTDPARAASIANSWWQIPYPIFKRLTLFAGTQTDVISAHQALDWLLAENRWWLWSSETKRESLRLLIALASKLVSSDVVKLEQAILEGPPREMYEVVQDENEWLQIVARDVWLRLAKLQASGHEMGKNAKTRLEGLERQFPNWLLAEDESDEFPFWVGEGKWIDETEASKALSMPRRGRELVEWLRKYDSFDSNEKYSWVEHCRNNFPSTACALYALTKEGVWRVTHWRLALQAWSDKELTKRSWRYMGPILNDVYDEDLQTLAHQLACWLQAIAETFESHETIFLNLCRRVLKFDYQDEENNDDSIVVAIDHPVGLVTEALLRWWYRGSPINDEGLPEALKQIFTELCETRISKFRYGRLILAAHVISIYRVDQDWATKHLLSNFDWQHSETEARLAWAGFLWSPRLYRPLLSDIKIPMLETAQRYTALDDIHAEQYISFLTFVALDPGDTFTTEELAGAMKHLPNSGLERVAQTLTSTLEGAGEQRSEYWLNRITPFLKQIWPQSNELITSKISENLALLCINAGDVFPEALNTLFYWLIPIEDPSYPINLLYEAELCKKHPTDALNFLDKIVGENAQWLTDDLQKCLNDIKQADQKLVTDRRFERLNVLYRRQEMGP